MTSMARTGCFLLALVLISGCRSHDRQANIAGISNPASVYCTQQGGMQDTLREHGVNVTYCLFPSGERVDEWTLYREKAHHFQ
ncbi:MAG: putative hemolysin [Scandinavium sp.]|uniref:putative hemolysin n=1 Tax=Scandinavium sp. TaxID=2830653 RepID=UPI003F3F362C